MRDPTNAAVGVTVLPDNVLVTTPIPTDVQGATFTVTVRQLGPADGYDARYLRVIATGTYRKAVRSVSMDFEIEKQVKFAVVGKVPIQLGRNTIVEGPIGMSTADKYPPILMLSDFTHFDATLKTRSRLRTPYLKGSASCNGKTIKNHHGYDNRISVNNQAEYQPGQAPATAT